MAHRGRTYPVHFRRDFNEFSDIRTPHRFAKGYTVKLDSAARPPYVVDGHTFLIEEIAGPDPATIAWLSPAYDIGIWFWQLRLHVSFWDLPTADLQATWFLERDAIMVSSWRGVHSDPRNPLAQPFPALGEVLFTDETTFDHGANFNYSLVDPTRYAA